MYIIKQYNKILVLASIITIALFLFTLIVLSIYKNIVSTKIIISAPKAYLSLPVYVAKEEDLFLKNGINAQIDSSRFTGQESFESLINGKSDLALGSTPTFITSHPVKNNLVILANIAIADKHLGIIVDKTYIKTPSDLEGRTICVNKGTSAEYFLDLWLEKKSLNTSKIEIIYAQKDECYKGFMDGTYKASVLYNQFLTSIALERREDVQIYYEDNLYYNHYVLAGKRDYIQNNPEIIKNVLQSLIDTEYFISNNLDETNKIAVESLALKEEVLKGLQKSFYKFSISLSDELGHSIVKESKFMHSLDKNVCDKIIVEDLKNIIYVKPLQEIKPENVNISI